MSRFGSMDAIFAEEFPSMVSLLGPGPTAVEQMLGGDCVYLPDAANL